MVHRSERATRIATGVAGAVLTVCAGFLGLTKIGDWFLDRSYDLPFLVHRAGIPDDLCIVESDQLAPDRSDMLDRREQPKLLRKLAEGGARMVVYDHLFQDVMPEVDPEFAAAIRDFRFKDKSGKDLPEGKERIVLLAAKLDQSSRPAASIAKIVHASEDLVVAAALDPNDPVFHLAAYQDDNYSARKITTGTERQPSLAWSAARHSGADLDEARRFDDRWLNYPGPPPILKDRTYRASDVIAGGVDPNLFEDKVVVVGAQRGILGDGLGKDIYYSPFNHLPGFREELLSGTEVQALMYGNLVLENWLTRSSTGTDSLLVIVAGLVLGIGMCFLRPMRGVLVAVVAVVVIYAFGVLSMQAWNTWFPWAVVAFVQVPVALVWGGGARYYVERFFRIKLGEEQEALRGAFAKYLSPPMLDQLTEEGFKMKLGGEKVEAVLLFTDLENFTSMCEQVNDPEWTLNTLNDYFERTTKHIFEHDGVVIGFSGDSIFAGWGAPLPDPESARKAARAAWDLFLSAKLLVDGEELRTRVGMHFGEVVAGNVGSTQHIEYTLIGDATNLASRLEGLNKTLGTSILLSEEMASRLDEEFFIRRVGCLRVKGRQEAITVFELVGPGREKVVPPWITKYHEAMEALEGNDFELARQLFEEVDAARGKGDGPSRFYLECLAQGNVLADGIVALDRK